MLRGTYIRTEEIKKKISEALKGRHLSEETKRKLSEVLKGNKRALGHSCSKEHKKHISEVMKGHITSEETKRKISKTEKGKLVPKGEKSCLWKGGIKESRRRNRRRNKSKRRSFDFVPLNEFFEGAVAHHLDKVYVVYIPEEVHRSITHSVLKNINMDVINAVAWNYI